MIEEDADLLDQAFDEESSAGIFDGDWAIPGDQQCLARECVD